MSVRSIIAIRGGPKGLADYARRHGVPDPDRPVTEKTIYSWFKSGIPEKHWDWVSVACDVDATTLHNANKELRAMRAEKVGQSQQCEGPSA
jgi:hypothetical protein